MGQFFSREDGDVEEEECGEEGEFDVQTNISEEEASLLRQRQAQAVLLHSLLKQIENSGKFRSEVTLHRLYSNWEKEKQFLDRLCTGELEISLSRLCSTNFSHIYALCVLILHPLISDICDVSLPVKYKADGITRKVSVDIVNNSGRNWVCIVARNAKQIRWQGECFGSKAGIKNRIQELLLASSKQPLPPSILLCVPEKTDQEIQNKIMTKFKAERVTSDAVSDRFNNGSFRNYNPLFFLLSPVTSDVTAAALPFTNSIDANIKYANLDTSTLIALASDISNGKSSLFLSKQHEIYSHMPSGSIRFMRLQAEQELEQPVLPLLHKLLEGKRLITTTRAKAHFKQIVDLIGTIDEKKRGEELLNKTEIMEEIDWAKELDCPDFQLEISDRMKALPESKTVGSQQREIFGLADSIPFMTTVTSNQGLVRAVSQGGVHLRVILHDPRALLSNKYQQFI